MPHPASSRVARAARAAHGPTAPPSSRSRRCRWASRIDTNPIEPITSSSASVIASASRVRAARSALVAGDPLQRVRLAVRRRHGREPLDVGILARLGHARRRPARTGAARRRRRPAAGPGEGARRRHRTAAVLTGRAEPARPCGCPNPDRCSRLQLEPCDARSWPWARHACSPPRRPTPTGRAATGGASRSSRTAIAPPVRTGTPRAMAIAAWNTSGMRSCSCRRHAAGRTSGSSAGGTARMASTASASPARRRRPPAPATGSRFARGGDRHRLRAAQRLPADHRARARSRARPWRTRTGAARRWWRTDGIGVAPLRAPWTAPLPRRCRRMTSAASCPSTAAEPPRSGAHDARRLPRSRAEQPRHADRGAGPGRHDLDGTAEGARCRRPRGRRRASPRRLPELARRRARHVLLCRRPEPRSSPPSRRRRRPARGATGSGASPPAAAGRGRGPSSCTRRPHRRRRGSE